MLDVEIREFLHMHGARLNTDLGQHFLTDEAVLADILSAANVQPGENVLEIGPGIGVLTRELLKAGANVHAIEIDQKLIPLLKSFVTRNQKPLTKNLLTVTHANSLHVPSPFTTPYSVVANIPYHITSPLLRHLLLESALRPTSLTLLIQREVAENICAPTTESILTILVGLFGSARFVRRVAAECFLPPPEVESAVIHIECYDNPLADPETIEKVLKLIKHAMSQRRKMLRGTIGLLPGGAEALQTVSIDPTRRPQTLTISEWLALEAALRKRV